VKVAQALDENPAPVLRANAIGIFQANIGLWQILARQGQIANENLNDSWQHVMILSQNHSRRSASLMPVRLLWDNCCGLLPAKLIFLKTTSSPSWPVLYNPVRRPTGAAELANRMHAVLKLSALFPSTRFLHSGAD